MTSWRWILWPLVGFAASCAPAAIFYGGLWAQFGHLPITEFPLLVWLVITIVSVATWALLLPFATALHGGVRTFAVALAVAAPIGLMQGVASLDLFVEWANDQLLAHPITEDWFSHLSGRVNDEELTVLLTDPDLWWSRLRHFALFSGVATLVGTALTRLLFIGSGTASKPAATASSSGATVHRLDVAIRTRDRLDYLGASAAGPAVTVGFVGVVVGLVLSAFALVGAAQSVGDLFALARPAHAQETEDAGALTAPPAAPSVSPEEMEAARERARAAIEEATGQAESPAPAAQNAIPPPAAALGPTPEELDTARERARAAAEAAWRPSESSRLQEAATAVLASPVAIMAGLLQVFSGLGCALMVLGLFSSRQIVPRRLVFAVGLAAVVASFAAYVLYVAVPSIRGERAQSDVSALAPPAAMVSLLLEFVLAAALIGALAGLALATKAQFMAAEGWRPPVGSFFRNFGRLMGLPNYVGAMPKRRLTTSSLFIIATFTGAGLALLWLYVARLPTAIASQLGEDLSVATIGGLLGIVLAIPFVWFLAKLGAIAGRIGRRTAANAYQLVRERDERAPILFLRAFNRDDQELALKRHGILPRLIGRFGVRATLDELLLDLASPMGPVVAIGRPSHPLPPLGAARVFVRGDDWQSVVTDLADAAQVIVICLDTTAGVRWEAETVSQPRYRSKTIFLTSPWADTGECWRQLSELLPGIDEIPSTERVRHPVAAFTDVPGGVTFLTAPAPTQQAYASAINWSLQAVAREWAPPPVSVAPRAALTLAGVAAVALVGIFSLAATSFAFSEVRAEIAAAASLVRPSPPQNASTAPRIEPPAGTEHTPNVPDLSPPPYISDPRWISRPSGRDFARVYPPAALEAGTGGRVVLSCTSDASGILSCTVLSEEPVGMGFAEAALALSGNFQLAPQGNGESDLEGAMVQIPINFRTQ